MVRQEFINRLPYQVVQVRLRYLYTRELVSSPQIVVYAMVRNTFGWFISIVRTPPIGFHF